MLFIKSICIRVLYDANAMNTTSSVVTTIKSQMLVRHISNDYNTTIFT